MLCATNKPFILSVIMVTVIVLPAIIQSVFLLQLSVVMLSVMLKIRVSLFCLRLFQDNIMVGQDLL
jgi:hypothetical protein